MEHDINLNIHYSAPEEVWESIDEVYKSMPYWAGNKKEPRWIGEGIDLWASVEPGGIQIAGTMPKRFGHKRHYCQPTIFFKLNWKKLV